MSRSCKGPIPCLLHRYHPTPHTPGPHTPHPRPHNPRPHTPQSRTPHPTPKTPQPKTPHPIIFTFSSVSYVSFVPRYLLDSGLGGGTEPQHFNTGDGSCFHGGGCVTEGSSVRRKDIFQSTVEEDSIENELEKTKVVRAYWDLRQEVRLTFRLRCCAV